MRGTQAEGNVDKSKYLYNLQPIDKCVWQAEYDSLLETSNCLKGKTTFAYQQPGLRGPVSLLEQMKALSALPFVFSSPKATADHQPPLTAPVQLSPPSGPGPLLQ